MRQKTKGLTFQNYLDNDVNFNSACFHSDTPGWRKLLQPVLIPVRACCTADGWNDDVFVASSLWWLDVSLWQHAGVTVINPFPLQACHLHNRATIPDAKASPHVYCYNYLTFKSTLMSPGWSHSLSSFGFQALLLSNKVTFHNTASPWNTHPPHKYTSTCICSPPQSWKGDWRNYKKIKL